MVVSPHVLCLSGVSGGVLCEANVVVWCMVVRLVVHLAGFVMSGTAQSSPLLSLGFPSDPVCLMLNAMAMMGFRCGTGNIAMWFCPVGSEVVGTVNQAGCVKGPLILPD